MRTHHRITALLLTATILSGCHMITGSDGGGGAKSITSATEAKALFAMLKTSGSAVDRQVATNFSGSTSVSGAKGTASVSGKKSSTSTSSSSSTTTTTQSDLQIAFAGFQPDNAVVTVTGSMRWFDYYSSRTACSSSFCASSSSRSEAVTGTSIHVEFSYNGESYSDTVTIDAESPSDVTSWDVKVTTKSGQVFTFTY